ncbi:hypothetical protein [Streptomyces sp. WMMB 322]|uniref:baeRF2 domain-containing protein n=1 Tax=Streptomyces sp. WMMB 322 TaxID=1286821 RepID=UPI0006E2A789|nr:hypothetical protein [Streptomyces sp. WMMB 322]SCK40713.1 hypothetical protein H180DRAFT_03520 [Streptomyces sp. WMMB 322]
MELSPLKSLYAEGEAFATVYLEGRSPGEDAADQIRLRWKSLRERLASDGADQAALTVLDDALARDKAGEEQANGRVLVASDHGRLGLDAPWDASLGAGDDAGWGVLPQLGAYAREATHAARVLLIVAGHEETELRRLVVARDLTESPDGPEDGAAEGSHNTHAGEPAHRRIRRRAEDTTVQDGDALASAVSSALSRFTPDVVILAGEVQKRTSVREQLPGHLHDKVVETSRGGAPDAGAREALDEEVLRIATEHVEQRLQDNASRLREALGHQDAVQGDAQVLKAAETGALETLFLEEETTAKRESLLLKEASRTGAVLALVPHGTGLEDGSAGILRFHPEG